MCIRIVGTEELEFSMSRPLEEQIVGATEILVNYDPVDPKIDFFINQIERLCNNGISCNVEIKVNTNNYLNGKKFEKKIEKIKRKLDVNEIVKGLTKFHIEADRKLSEMSEICLEKADER